MSEFEPTRIGRVRQVLGSQLTVELDPMLAGVTPIFRGQLQSIGQIGSLVRIPQGLVDLVGSVTMLGIAELAGSQVPTETLRTGERWLQVQLLGEIDKGTRRFQRGVGVFPGLDDAVHFARDEDLTILYPRPDHDQVRVGALSASEGIPVCLNLEKLVSRHSAIVGSTGSGKTSAVASLLQTLASGEWPSANVIVIDTHGEYGRALGGTAAVQSVLGAGAAQLRVPFWALPASDILRAFTGTNAGPTTSKSFSTLVAEKRRAFVSSASWLALDPAAVTADTPVPFDIHAVWHDLDFENNETRTVKADASTSAIESPGVPRDLIPTKFVPNGAGGAAPHQGPFFGVHGMTPELLRLGLVDPHLAFLRGLEGTPEGPDPLAAALRNWLGDTKPVSVLDFSGVPDAAAELAIGVILKLLFETAIRTPNGGTGIGRPRPVLVVLEEAHRYLSDASTSVAGVAANRIAREGRKYGIGLMLVTQRPSELPDTALAQCGTLIALRLTNSADQGRIRHALPDSVAGLAETLPSLRTGEAIISGEAVTLPTRVHLDLPDPLPLAEDPSILSWQISPSTHPDVSAALERWRGIYEATE
jgi:hypothetical protein